MNGSYLLLAGERGQISVMSWREKDLICEFNVNEKILDAKFLQNDTMFAVAQKSKIYIYDKQGIELHSLDYQSNPKFIQYLPYHFLMVTVLGKK
jgi:U3 small nucleolar RNA-associated protein 7